MSLLLKNITLQDLSRTNILIEDGKYVCMDASAGAEASEIMDCEGLAILPSFFNMHCHAAMCLMRGYADDMDLHTWLNDYIWPFEAKLTDDDVVKGADLAVNEMLSSGTTYFNDMYFVIEKTIPVVEKYGMRATLSATVMENHTDEVVQSRLRFAEHFRCQEGSHVSLSIAPHAIYTVGPEKFRMASRFAREHGMMLHTHLSETRKEVDDCLEAHGLTPVRYLDSLGVLGPEVVAAHCVHLDREEWDILAQRGVTVVHCPCSNMKLSSGRFSYENAISSGCRVTLGTDGASSGNNLDMREAMKFASLLAKVEGDPELLTASEVFRWATLNGAEAAGVDAGLVQKGKLADFVLIDMGNIRMKPCYNLISNWVYSADSSCVAAVGCNGKIVYRR